MQKIKNGKYNFLNISRCMIYPLELSLKANKVKIPWLKSKSLKLNPHQHET